MTQRSVLAYVTLDIEVSAGQIIPDTEVTPDTQVTPDTEVSAGQVTLDTEVSTGPGHT